jgi:hypothetical protein
MVRTKREGLYYTQTDVLTVDKNPMRRSSHMVQRLATPHTTGTRRSDHGLVGIPWGGPNEHAPRESVTGIPSFFQYHPVRFVDFKEQACIRKQAAQWLAECTTNARKQFYMD